MSTKHFNLNSTGITRPFNPLFWQDRYIRTLDQNTKSVYIFLITSHKVNLSGIYEISAGEIARYALCDELRTDDAYAAIDRLKEDGKILYEQGWVALINRMKHQSLNPNMVKGLVSQLEELAGLVPESFDTHIETLLEGYGKAFRNSSRKGRVRVIGRVIGRVSDASSGAAAQPEHSDTHTVGNKKMGESFEMFWNAYPKKVHKNEAQTMFDKCWDVIEENMPKILEFIEKAKGTNRWREPKYIPDPASFLEDNRWNDSIEMYGSEKKRIHLDLS